MQYIYSKTFKNEQHTFSCYPNPTNKEFNVKFNIEKNTKVGLTIYNLQGKQMMFLPKKEYPTGQQTINLNVKDLAPSIYVIKLTINEKDYYEKFIKQ